MNKVDKNEKNVQRCAKCNRVVGCDMDGRKHKCCKKWKVR